MGASFVYILFEDGTDIHWARSRSIMLDAYRKLHPAWFWSLLIIAVSLLPVFALEAQEGRLFHPLAFTKTFARAGAALLSVSPVPVLLFVRGHIPPEGRIINRLMIRPSSR